MAALLQKTNITTTNTDLQLYQVSPGKIASFSLNLCNRTSGKVKVSVALSTTISPSDSDWIEFNSEILPGESLQRLGLVLGDGNYVFVKSDTAGVSAVLWGFVE